MALTLTEVLSFFALIGHVALLGIILLFFLNRRLLLKIIMRRTLWEALLCIFVISLLGSLGSLYFSNVLKYPPCPLCWYQRILLFPQVIISFFGIIGHVKGAEKPILVMSVLGAGVASYQVFITYSSAFSVCGIGPENCAINYTTHMGYISLPVLALTAFLWLIVLSVCGLYIEMKRNNF